MKNTKISTVKSVALAGILALSTVSGTISGTASADKPRNAEWNKPLMGVKKIDFNKKKVEK